MRSHATNESLDGVNRWARTGLRQFDNYCRYPKQDQHNNSWQLEMRGRAYRVAHAAYQCCSEIKLRTDRPTKLTTNRRSAQQCRCQANVAIK